ncbi:MAG: pre-16S rRNA-processing nuclease YqgF [Lachnospiraceae bacterium]|nr:pre-16S rRNA-processing nuclease YqgF [Lachnospiraceae bacterium]
MGIDYGDFTIGLAIFDVETDYIYPYKTIYRDRANVLRKSIREIVEIVDKENITDIVIGYPINMDDTEGDRVEKVKKFKNLLECKLEASIVESCRGCKPCEPVYVHFQDERLTTKEARDLLASHGIKKADEKKYIDQVAAEIILQDYKRKEQHE